ncbi:MFS transporter [Bordetella flabilis]|uniref:MFS transporter n=1 Tax=Bordetella flabilis TaxID=463014 RepID=A0A193GBV7_9BORD|nr:MFS transporter [Bordetella flabilis]ANN77497.1 MFS transporter [Bordetella flabilis]
MSAIQPLRRQDRPRATHTAPVFLFAVATGVIVTNLFAPQTLVNIIGSDLGFPPAWASLVATASLIGYAAGLIFLVPLADMMENRRLVLRMIVAAVLAGGTVGLARNGVVLLGLLFLLGAACSAIQILVPLAASMVPAEQSGRVIGNVMSGVLVGILVSRPLASIVAGAWGWRSFYAASVCSLSMILIVLAIRLPRRHPAAAGRYGPLLASLWHLLRDERVLRARAFTAAMSMASFSLFWTSVALRLAAPPFKLDQSQIALFALAGAGGAAATPFFGRMADRGWRGIGTTAAHLAQILAAGLCAWAGVTVTAGPVMPLVALTAGAVILDIGVTGDQTLGRHSINLIRPEARGRLNGLFVGLFFLGGSLGSALSSPAWAVGGWPLVCALVALFAFIALVVGRWTKA